MGTQLVQQVHDLSVQAFGLVLNLVGEEGRFLVGWYGLLFLQLLLCPLLKENIYIYNNIIMHKIMSLQKDGNVVVIDKRKPFKRD